jgi:hypothetical protein
MEVVFHIFKIFTIVFVSTLVGIQMLQTMFVDLQLFRSSSSEVVFHGGRLPDSDNFENHVHLYLSRPKNVTKHVLLISSYLGHRPKRSSSMEVVFQIFKFSKFCAPLA